MKCKLTKYNQFYFQVTACNPVVKRMEVSDGVYKAKCFLTGMQNTKSFLDNPIIQIVEWRLKLCAGIKLFIIEKFVIVKNCLKFPVLGSPKHLDKSTFTTSPDGEWEMEEVSKIPRRQDIEKDPYANDKLQVEKYENEDGDVVRTIRIKKKILNQAQEDQLPITKETWEAVICFLNNVDVRDDMDLQTFLEETSKDIFSRIVNTSRIEAGIARYQCSDCPFKGHYLRHLVNHIQLEHLKDFPGYKCPDCGRKILTFLDFEKHVKTQHLFKHTRNSEAQNDSLKPAKNNSKSQPNEKANPSFDASNILESMENHFLFVNRPTEDPEKEEEDKEIDWTEQIDNKIRLSGDLFHCTACSYNNKQIEELLYHIQMQHVPNFPGYSCLNCRQHFQYILTFLHHFRLTHSKIRITETYKHIHKPLHKPKFSLKPSIKQWLNSTSDSRML